jgi:DNA-binding winged helix-turn-helix (wHTH) protein
MGDTKSVALIFRFDDFELDAEQLELRRAGELIRADALVLRLLRCLARNAGRLVSKDELVAQVWNAHVVADNAITVAVARLRKTLGSGKNDRHYVTTMYGRGYRLECEVTAIEIHDRPPSLLVRAYESAPPFVGRDRVLASLTQALTQACDRRGTACVVLGEPGIGKSRVLEELAREATGSEVRVAWGYCRETGDTPPLDPWLRILREVLVQTPTASLEANSLAPAATLLSELLNEHDASLQNPATVDRRFFEGGTRHRTLDILARSFAAAADATPWLFVLEDIHRADAASLEFLAYLLDELRRTRILVVATARPAPVRRTGGASTMLMRVLGHSNCQRITLERLSREHVNTYVAAVLQDEDGQLANAVYDKCEGNPFFMAELSRRLKATDRPQPEALSVPSAALDMLWQPIARLDAKMRRVLSAAATLGRNFELSRLQAVVDGEPSELISALDEALATDLVIAAPGSMTAFAFGHELLRSVLYDALEPAERRGWHLRICHVLERCRIAGEPIPPSDLAHHSYSALPDSDPRKTIEHCRAAAAAAAARFANVDVVRYMKQSLEALDLIDGASIRLRMNLLFTIALYARGCDPEESIRALTEVLRLANERSDAPELVRAGCMLNVHVGYKPLGDPTAPLLRALELLREDNAALRSIALVGLACSAPQCYSATRQRALFAEGVPLARAADAPTSLYAALTYQLWATGGPAEPTETAELLRELELLARDHPKKMPLLPLDLAMYRGFAALQQGDQIRATTAFEHGASRARWFGKGELGWHIERARVIMRMNSGQCAGVLEELAALHRKARTYSIFGAAPFWAFDRAVIARELDGEVSNETALRAALAYDKTEPPSIWSMKVRALAAAGFNDEAYAALRAVPPEALAELPCDTHYLGTLGHLTRAALALGAREYLAALYPLLARFPNAFAVHVSVVCEGSISQLLGMVAHVLGRRAEGIAHLERGIAMAERAGFSMSAADGHLELARCLAADTASARSPRVKTLAREVQSTAERIGARRLMLEATSTLRLVS